MLQAHSYRRFVPAAMALGALGLSANAQDTSDDVVPSVSVPSVMMMHTLAELWMTQGSPPDDNTRPVVFMRGVVGVRVELRLEGSTVGYGEALRADALEMMKSAEATGADAAHLLAEACTLAFAQMEKRFADLGSAVKVSDMASRMTLSVQVCHSPQQIVLSTQAAKEALYSEYIPGCESLILHMPQTNVLAVQFAAEMLSAGWSQSEQWVALLDEQQQSRAALSTLCRPGGGEVWRLPTIEIARARPSMEVNELVRGTPLVSRKDISANYVRGLAGEVVSHLISKVDAQGLLAGNYRMAQDDTLPEHASPAEAALVAWALTRYAAWRMDDKSDVNEQGVRKCLETVSRLTRPVVVAAQTPGIPQDASALALLLLTMCDAPAPMDRVVRDEIASILIQLDRGSEGYARPLPPQVDPNHLEELKSRRLHDAEAALVAYALAAWYDRTRNSKVESLLRVQLDAASARVGAKTSIESLYWLLLAEKRVGSLLVATAKDSDVSAKARQQRLLSLQKALERVQALQVRTLVPGAPKDVLGGYSGGMAAGVPMPNWRSAYGVSSQSLWCAISEPKDDELSDLLIRQIEGLRFLSQLTVTKDGTGNAKRPERCVGGVRKSPWEPMLHVQADAMTLLSCVEMLEMIYALESSQ